MVYVIHKRLLYIPDDLRVLFWRLDLSLELIKKSLSLYLFLFEFLGNTFQFSGLSGVDFHELFFLTFNGL